MNLRVLVVDDSMIMRRKIKIMLEDLGHTVIYEAKNGEDALLSYAQKMPDFVTMDITMPEVDGIEATKNIIESFPRAKIIMVTSHGQENLVIKAIKAGAKGYILKPLKEEKIAIEIEKLFKNNENKEKEIDLLNDDLFNDDIFSDDFFI